MDSLFINCFIINSIILLRYKIKEGASLKINNAEERLDPRLVKVLKRIKEEKLPDDYDCVVIAEAPERGGKTTLLNLMCAVIDPSFTIEERNIYTQENFQKFIRESKKMQAVNSDEGANMWYKRNAMTKDNKSGVLALTMMGQKNLFVTVAVTDAALLEDYLLFKRCRIFIRVTKRGRFKFYKPASIKEFKYDAKRKKMLYPSATFAGWFGKLTEEEFNAMEKNKFDRINMAQGFDDVNTEEYISAAKAAEQMMMTRSGVIGWIKKGQLYAIKNPAGAWRVPISEVRRKLGEVAVQYRKP